MSGVKISLIGAGNIGGNLAYMASIKRLAEKIVLLDINEGFAKGKALDITQTLPLEGVDSKVIGTSNYSDIAGSKVVIITAGITRKPGMSREDLIQTNSNIIADISKNIKQYAPDAFLIVITNPLDAMAWVMKKVTGFSRNMVVGMAGILDSTRFRVLIAEALGVSANDVNAMVLGSHGDSMVPLIRYCTVNGLPLSHFVKLKMITDAKIKEFVEKTKNGGAEIVELLKTSAYYAPAASAIQITEAFLKNKKSILPCSVCLEGEYGVKDVFSGVPVIIGSSGVEKIIELDFNDEEKVMFDNSVKIFKNLIAAVKI